MHIKGIRFEFPLVKRLGLLKHRATYRVTWNQHAGVEIHYVLKGDIAWELDRAKPLTVPGGFFGIISSKTKHRAIGNEGTPALRLGIIFEQPSPKMAKGTPFSTRDLLRIFSRLEKCGGTIRRFSFRLASILRELSKELNFENVADADGQLRLRLFLCELLCETYKTLGEPESLAVGHEVVPRIRQWIDAHFAEKITLSHLVKLSGYGRSRFFTLFLADTGMTPNDYLVRTRIEQAKRKLSQSSFDGSMLDLALSCGFNSASVFSATFRKYVGMTPRTFAQNQSGSGPSGSGTAPE